ncbi:MAG: amidohydrolase [Pseudonocardiales bacterium]|nr:MAG: amidohydrolase [Pseudonocardiales bacterium]
MSAVDDWLAGNEAELIDVRRDLRAHPELGHAEYRTTALITDRLRAAGLLPSLLPRGTGVICDVGNGAPRVALRADIDALPLPDLSGAPYASTVDGVCHACGHDVHTAVVLGAALALATMNLPDAVRVVFQPAEESTPGGALDVVAAGALEGVQRMFALHCDPHLEVGSIGLRVGPITAASDKVEVRLSGPGGHTARPQLTVDLVYALGRVITDVPGMLSRVVDPRASLSLVWGAVNAGVAPNTIPQTGVLRGTIRVLDRDSWGDAEKLVRELVDQVVAPTGASAEIEYVRGVPPVVNDAGCTEILRRGVVQALGPDAVADTPQSMGGEDFAWYLDTVPGALVRLGVRRPESTPFDLHQGTFDIDENALAIGVAYTVALARTALTTQPLTAE